MKTLKGTNFEIQVEPQHTVLGLSRFNSISFIHLRLDFVSLALSVVGLLGIGFDFFETFNLIDILVT